MSFTNIDKLYYQKLKISKDIQNLLILTTLTVVLVLVTSYLITRFSGRLSWPVTGRISSGFGPRTHPITGEKGKFHNGIDIAIPSNTPIFSPAKGTVKNVYYNSSGGNSLVIAHTNGFTSGYAHLTKSIVSIGEKVDKGQIIAYSGNTGSSTAPHLHFTLKNSSGEYVDPQKHLV